MSRKPRWPSRARTERLAQAGIIDDTMATVSPFCLKDWEILGVPAPPPSQPDDSHPGVACDSIDSPSNPAKLGRKS